MYGLLLHAVEFIKSNPLDERCAHSTQSSCDPHEYEGDDANGVVGLDDALHDASPLHKAFRDHISKIDTPVLAREAAISLRQLLEARDTVSDIDLHNVFVRHNIRMPMSRPFPENCTDANRLMARRTLQVLEQSYRMLACLPRTLDDIIVNPDTSHTSHPATSNGN